LGVVAVEFTTEAIVTLNGVIERLAPHMVPAPAAAVEVPPVRFIIERAPAAIILILLNYNVRGLGVFVSEALASVGRIPAD
jgi:hypothetical protein